jgi:hypothetical protein
MTERASVHPSVLGLLRQEIGHATRHLIAGVLLAAAFGAVAVEAAGVALTQALPALPTHLAAAAVALTAAYAAAITVLFRVLLRAIGRSAEWFTTEIEQATKRILHEGDSSPLGGRERMYAESVVSSTVATPGANGSAAPSGTMLEDGVIAGFRAD